MSNFDEKNFNLQSKAQNEITFKDNLENTIEDKNKDNLDFINKINGKIFLYKQDF